ncbi:MAG: hypothetical protein U0175_25815 [Caldilineaceae bacterium]
MVHESYTFWIWGWDVTPVVGMLPKFSPVDVRCEITQATITIFTPKGKLMFPLNQVELAELDQVPIGRYAGGITNLRLELTDSPEVRSNISATAKLWIVPTSVLANPPSPSFDEASDMLNTIESFKTEKVPSIHPNPYYRAWQRSPRRRKMLEQFSEKEWNAATPPHVYTPIINPWKLVLIIVAIGVGIVGSLMLLVGLIFNLFFRG